MSDFDENSGNLYDSFEESLADADCEISASEFQGILAGMISAGLKQGNSSWSSTVLQAVNDGHPLSSNAQEWLEKIFSDSLTAFAEQDVLAPILLPNDDYPLIDRLEAVSFWCQGYLLGFGLQLGKQSIDSSEVTEALHDVSEISQLELAADESEESQIALEILIEHIKVAVKVIHMELVIKQQRTEINPVDGNDTYH